MGKKPNIKKEIVLIKYLKEEHSECKLVCETAKREIEESIRHAHFDLNVYDESLDSSGQKAKQEKCKIEEDDLPDKEDTSKSVHPPWAKKTFRNIARMTHPDKVPERLDDTIKKKFVESYQKAKQSIDVADYVELALVAIDLGIDIEQVDPNFYKLLEEKKSELSSSINAMKSSMYWIWAHTDDQKKEEMLREFVKERGWSSASKQRSKSRKGPGNHPGKSLTQMKKMKILKKKLENS